MGTPGLSRVDVLRTCWPHPARHPVAAWWPPWPWAHLPDELALLVHTDVLLALSPLDAYPAAECVRLHYELGCEEKEGPLSVQGAAGTPSKSDLQAQVRGTGTVSSQHIGPWEPSLLPLTA